MRTMEEILHRMHNSDSFFGFDKAVMLSYVAFADAKSLLKEEFVNKEGAEEEWNKDRKPLTEEVVLAEMKDYMEFAWGKAEDHRGLSAGRSVEKFETWIWMLGHGDFLKTLEDTDYPQYGCPKLAAVSERYGFDVPDSKELQNMIQSKPCGADYACGCGS